VDGLWATKSEGVGPIAVQLVSKIYNLYVILMHQGYRQTDGRHAIARPRFASASRGVNAQKTSTGRCGIEEIVNWPGSVVFV